MIVTNFYKLLLSLLPLFCIVVLVREVVNKHYSFSSAFSTNPIMFSYPSDIEMNNIDNGKMRECLASSSNCSSRDPLVLLNVSSKPYHERMEIKNKLLEVDSINPIDSSQLFYAGTAKVDSSVSLTTDKKAASSSEYVNNKVPALKKGPKLCSNSKGTQIKGINPTPSKYMSENVVNTQILSQTSFSLYLHNK